MSRSQKPHLLRVCMSCSWIYSRTQSDGCPLCNYPSYSARFVFGDKAYQYSKSQEPYRKSEEAKIALRIATEQAVAKEFFETLKKAEDPRIRCSTS